MKGTTLHKIKMHTFFIIYFILDFILLYFLINIRATSVTDEFGIKLAVNDPFVPILWPLLFFLQHLMVFYGFFSVSRKEEKYLLFPKDESGAQRYHYFTPQQLLIFIEISSKTITGKDNDYSKIYVTKEPKPNMFTYKIFGRKTIVLNPTMLQIAETQELRANLIMDLELANNSSLIRIYASQHSKFFFIPFIGPLLPFIREIAILIFFDPSKDGNDNPLQKVLLALFLIFGIFITMSIIKKIFSAIINTSNRNLILFANLKAAELVGAIAVINTLLKIGHRQEAIEVILDEMQYLEELERGKLIESLERSKLIKLVQKFPIASIDHDVALKMAPEIFITQKLDVLEKIYNCEFHNKQEIIDNSVKNLLKNRMAFIAEWKSKILSGDNTIQIPNSVDLQLKLERCLKLENFNVRETLSDEEIAILILELMKKPRKHLFVHEPIKTPIWSRTPTISDQIIAVNKVEFRG